MTPAEFATHVRYKTRTNSTTFPDADILALMKIRQDEIARDILQIDEKILLIPQTTNLVANQRLYAFPSDIISRIGRVEAMFDGTNWVKLFSFDVRQFQYPLDETHIVAYFTNNEAASGDMGARYDIYRKSLYLLSGTIANVTNGLKVYTHTYPAVVASLAGATDMSVDPSTTTHGIPRELHEIWARGVIIDFKESRENPIPLTEREQKYEYDKNKAIQALKHTDQDRVIVGAIPNEGNNGEDF
jgi:hypothetical protein